MGYGDSWDREPETVAGRPFTVPHVRPATPVGPLTVTVAAKPLALRARGDAAAAKKKLTVDIARQARVGAECAEALVWSIIVRYAICPRNRNSLFLQEPCRGSSRKVVSGHDISETKKTCVPQTICIESPP